MRTFIALLFVFAGLINLAPVVGVTSAAMLERMYGVPLGSPDLVLLMRHRAVLLAIVGALLLAAAARPALKPVATLAGFSSMLSYLALAAGEPAANASLRQVATFDVVGALALAAGAALDWRRSGVRPVR